MEIVKVNKEDSLFKEIVDIYFKWWGFEYFDSDSFYNYYKSVLEGKELPSLYALLDNNKLIGMYEINEHDRIDVSESPFLSNIFVKEEYRGKGYSRLLINDAINEAKKMGYKDLYLRSHHENYYEKFGFVLLKEVETKIGRKRIFGLKLI